MAERIKWGVLGNATIARKCVIPAIRKSRNGFVYALGTRSPAGARELIAENSIRHVYDSYDAVLKDSAVDAVYIPLPNHLHYQCTLKALRAGKHVLCEKPIACNQKEAREMVTAASEKGLHLMEAFMYRFHGRSRIIKRIIENGEIGPLSLVRSAFCFRMDDDVLNSLDNNRLKPERGGGALLDVGCYSVSLARWFFGIEPSLVQAMAIYHEKGSDVHMVGTLMFPEKGLATIEASFISALQQTYTAVGAEGAIELPHDAFIPWEKDAVFIVRGKDDEVGQEHIVGGEDEYQRMVEFFTDVVQGYVDSDLNLEESVSNMKVLDALAKSAKTGKAVQLNKGC